MGGFSYHDNAVIFNSDGYGVPMQSGNFTVRDFSISSGQDPSNVNHIGDVHVLDVGQPSQSSLTFRAGRHKTDPVARFWANYVAPNQNTLNKSPDQLNFAYVGDLVLQIQSPALTATLPNMVLGQGSTTVAGTHISDWWIGGPNCRYQRATSLTGQEITSGQAKCSGTDENGQPVTIKFWYQNCFEAWGWGGPPGCAPNDNMILVQSVDRS